MLNHRQFKMEQIGKQEQKPFTESGEPSFDTGAWKCFTNSLQNATKSDVFAITLITKTLATDNRLVDKINSVGIEIASVSFYAI